MLIFWKNCESFLEHPKKNLGSTPPLLVKITVQWFYFHHKNFNRKSIGITQNSDKSILIYPNESQ